LRVDDDDVLDLLVAAAEAVRAAIAPLVDRYSARPNRSSDAADEADEIAERAALEILGTERVLVLSEGAGWVGDGDVEVVLDPIDGTNNLVRGIPYSGPSIFAVDQTGRMTAVVLNAFTGRTFWARTGAGAFRDGERLRPIPPVAGDVIVGGAHDLHGGSWPRQFGATAHTLCAVAEGRLDGYRTPADGPDRSWDLLAGALIASEAGCDVRVDGGGDVFAIDRLADAWIAATWAPSVDHDGSGGASRSAT
jgi:myo-inositol-1(or 4)-monophosphatase